MIEEILVLPDVADEPVFPELAQIQCLDKAAAEYLVVRGEADIGAEFRHRNIPEFLGLQIPHQGGRVPGGVVDDADLGITAVDVIDHVHGAVFPETEKQVLLFFMPGADVVEADGCVGETGHGNSQTASLMMHLADEAVEAVHLVQDDLTVAHEGFPVPGQAGTGAGPLEQFEAHIFLNALDDMTKLGL